MDRYTKNMTYEDFEVNDLVQDAVIRNIEIMGEQLKIYLKNLQKRILVLIGAI